MWRDAWVEVWQVMGRTGGNLTPLDAPYHQSTQAFLHQILLMIFSKIHSMVSWQSICCVTMPDLRPATEEWRCPEGVLGARRLRL